MNVLAWKFAETDDGEGVWVTPEDFRELHQDSLLYGNAYVKPVKDDPIVTHQRIPPSEVSHEPA